MELILFLYRLQFQQNLLTIISFLSQKISYLILVIFWIQWQWVNQPVFTVRLILLVLLLLRQSLKKLVMEDYSDFVVLQEFHWMLRNTVEVSSNLKVHLRLTLVYLLLVMDIPMECLVMQLTPSMLNIMVKVYSLHSLVVLNLLPSILKRSKCYSPSLEDIQVSASLMVHGMVLEESRTLLLLKQRSNPLIGLVLVKLQLNLISLISIHLRNLLRLNYLRSEMSILVILSTNHQTRSILNVIVLIHLLNSWMLIMDCLLIQQSYLLQQSLLRQLHLMLLLQQESLRLSKVR